MKTLLRTLPVLVVLAVLFTVVLVADHTRGVYTDKTTSTVKVLVTDLEGTPLQNADVRISDGQTFHTDNRGYSPSIEVQPTGEDNWFPVTVVVMAEGYVNTALFGCVVFVGSERVVQIRMYRLDELFAPGLVRGYTVTNVIDLSFLLIPALLFLLSYVFRYGEELQTQSDETL